MADLFIVSDPPEVRCGEEPLHHLIQSGEPKTNTLIVSRRNGYGWGLGRREPPFADVIAESWLGRIFYGAVDIGGRDSAFENRDKASVERMVRQYHKLLCCGVL
jgi:hypothetical protein